MQLLSIFTKGSGAMAQRIVAFLLIFLLLASVAMAKEKKQTNVPKTLSIEETVYGVLRTHRSLRGMRENHEVLRHELSRAKAGFGPHIDLEGRTGESLLSDATTRGTKLDQDMYGSLSASAKLVQPIWDGFATRSRVRDAASSLESMRYRVFDSATSLSLDGIIAHIDVLRRRKIVDLAVENIREHREILSQARERARLGADTAAEVTQTQSRLSRAQSNLSEARAALVVAEQTYLRLTGLVPNALQPVTLPPDVFESADSVYDMAQKANPKLASYLHDIRSQVARRELTEASFYPTFNLEVGPTYSNRSGSTDRWIYSFDVLATMRWNIFNSWADVAEKKAASARIRQYRHQLYDYLDTLKLEIETSWANYKAAKEEYHHYARAVEYNKYTKMAYIEQFTIGKRSLLDVLDTINELYTSSTQAETARGNILVGAYRLSGLTGNLLPSMGITSSFFKKAVPRDRADRRERFAPSWFH